MRPLTQDLSIYKKFNFEHPPVGVKYLFHKPEGIQQIDKTMAFCEMIKEAQRRGTPFYFTKEDEDCFGKVVLGMEEAPPILESGALGIKLEIFQEPRANARLYQSLPRLAKGTVNYVALSKLDGLTFEPDLLVLVASPSQAEIVLRAMTYSTGEILETKSTSVLACSWLYAYPYQSGKVNFVFTGLGFGMKVHKVFPEGRILLSIPYQWIPIITQNLQEMKWELPSFTDSTEEFAERKMRVLGELEQESINP